MAIKHIWFDFSETIAHINKQEHDRLKYEMYAKVVGKTLDDRLRREFDEQYERHNHSISDVFHSLGKPAGWWSQQITAIDPAKLFVLAQPNIPEIIHRISNFVPVSIFSNINLANVLPSLGIDVSLFAHILSSSTVKKPKPALDGFVKIVELSQLRPNEILYVGDHETKDIVPAKQVGLQAGMIWNKSDMADYNFDSFDDILKLAEE
jgi:FMN phosphatase YigB (HAD superfamily)